MDGSGIDFVEADFGAESLQNPGISRQRTPEEWKKWSESPFRTPLIPVIGAVVFFFLMAFLPTIAEKVLQMKMAEQYAKENAPAPAATGYPAVQTFQPPTQQSYQQPPQQTFPTPAGQFSTYTPQSAPVYTNNQMQGSPQWWQPAQDSYSQTGGGYNARFGKPGQ